MSAKSSDLEALLAARHCSQVLPIAVSELLVDKPSINDKVIYWSVDLVIILLQPFGDIFDFQ